MRERGGRRESEGEGGSGGSGEEGGRDRDSYIIATSQHRARVGAYTVR